MALSVKCQTLDFGSGHDLRVVRLSPHRAPQEAWSLLTFSLLLSFYPSLLPVYAVSQKKQASKLSLKTFFFQTNLCSIFPEKARNPRPLL